MPLPVTTAARLLLVNPNTSRHITERLALSARAVLPPGAQLTALTADSGPAAVRSPEELAAAAERVLAMTLSHPEPVDAVLIGISLDCGLAATRAACAPTPVLGMTEAACLTAAALGPRFAVLTVGAAMAESYRQHVLGLGWGDALVGVAAPECPAAFSAAPDVVLPEVLDILTAAAQPLCDAGALSVVLAGAVLCGYGPALQQRLGVPVLDGVACGVTQLLSRLNPA